MSAEVFCLPGIACSCSAEELEPSSSSSAFASLCQKPERKSVFFAPPGLGGRDLEVSRERGRIGDGQSKFSSLLMFPPPPPHHSLGHHEKDREGKNFLFVPPWQDIHRVRRRKTRK